MNIVIMKIFHPYRAQAPYDEQAKIFSRTFLFLQRYSIICYSPHGQHLRGHTILALDNPPFTYFQNVAIG